MPVNYLTEMKMLGKSDSGLLTKMQTISEEFRLKKKKRHNRYL